MTILEGKQKFPNTWDLNNPKSQRLKEEVTVTGHFVVSENGTQARELGGSGARGKSAAVSTCIKREVPH